MKLILLPASIPYIDDPMPEWVDEWGVQLFVKVELEGKEGFGEVLVAGSGVISSYIGIFHDLIIPFLEKKEGNISINEIYEVLEKMLFSAGLSSITLGSISGVEMGLWHVYSRLVERPIYYLLGGKVRDAVPVYASFPRYRTIDDVIKAVNKAIERGFKIVKIHQPPAMVKDTLKKIRETFGDIQIAVDLNSPFDYSSVIKLLNEIYKYDVEWIEEPIYPPNDYDSLKKLSKDFPIAAGENEYTLQGFKKLLEADPLYIQPDISKIGGISKFLKVIALAETYNIKVMPHLRPQRSAIALFHTLQVASTRNSILRVEFPLAEIPSDLFKVSFRVKDGLVNVPDDISIDEEVLKSKYGFKEKIRILKFSDLANKNI